MLQTEVGLRVLGPEDVPAVVELAARNPSVHVFVDFRARTTDLEPRRLGGEVWGYVEDGELLSVCHAAANLIAVEPTPRALDAFAAKAAAQGRRCVTIGGLMADVQGLWERLEGAWPSPRDLRWSQPHLETSAAPLVPADPAVRLTRHEDIHALYPACVAMHVEELGASPEAGGAADLYRARIHQLIERGWSFARIENGKVLFKAEVASATPHCCQVQGVYVDPAHRGTGLGTAGMAAVVELALRHIAPVVSLYVNEHNVPARRAYERVGFSQTAEFATVLY